MYDETIKTGDDTTDTVPAADNAPKQPASLDKPLRRTPAFWQAIFAACLFLNAIVTSWMLHEQKTLTRQQVVGTQAAEVSLILSLYPNNALSVTFDYRGWLPQERYGLSSVR